MGRSFFQDGFFFAQPVLREILKGDVILLVQIHINDILKILRILSLQTCGNLLGIDELVFVKYL